MADSDEYMEQLIAYLSDHNLNRWSSMAAFLHRTSGEHAAENEALRSRVEAAEAANELDRTRVARALAALNQSIMGRQWMLDGRGPYEWDDDDYRAEFSLWMDDIQEAAKHFARIAKDWHGCPMDRTEIRHARAMLGEDIG